MDVRFDVPLYTTAEAAAHLGLARSTLRYWIAEHGLVHTVTPETPRSASLPFIAIAEAQFIRGLRNAGLTFDAVAVGIRSLRRHLGLEYIVHRDKLAHDGREVLVNLADGGAEPEWIQVRDGQGGIPGIIEQGLRTIEEWAVDGYPQRVKLPTYGGADVIVDPRFAFGQPIIERRGVRVEDVAQMFLAGDKIDTVTAEFGVDRETVESIVRVYARRAA
ncbi:MAG: MerR family transcriptional regulator [Acidimicrobiales bacterium]